MSNITTIIVTHNNAVTITACIETAKMAGVQHIIVVDNNSTDASADRAASLGATVIKNTQNVGFGAAANQGAAQATTPYLLFLNPDTQLHRSAVAITIQYLEEHRKVAIAGLALTDPKADHIEMNSFGKFPTLWHLFARKLSKPKPLGKEAIAVDWVSGGALMIRQKIWQQVKGFDPQFFLYWEDVDLCRRVKNLKPSLINNLKRTGWRDQGRSPSEEHRGLANAAAGRGGTLVASGPATSNNYLSNSRHTIVILPTATCLHVRGASLADKRTKARVYDAGADRYFRKHYPGIIWGIQHYMRQLYRLVQPYSQ